MKGACAGFLVAFSTAIASRIGPNWSGLLLIFPVGFLVLSGTVFRLYGPETVIATLYSAMLGSMSLATFCFVLAIGFDHVNSWWVFCLGILASVIVTGILGHHAFRRL
jgi:hypothetical protein